MSQRLELKKPNKHVALQKLSIYYTCKKLRKQYKNNKLKVIAQTWKGESELPDGSYSVSDVRYYVEYIIKKHETSTTVPPVHVYINRTSNKLVFKIKDGHKLEL